MKPSLDIVAILAGLAGLTFFWVRDCTGPQPHVVAIHAEPPVRNGEPWRVELTVTSGGPGEGSAAASVKLTDPQTGEVWESEENVDLQPHQTAHVTAEIYAPSRALTPSARVDFPPR